MNEGFVGVMFFLTFFGCIFGVAYFYYTTRNRERLALIEKNADASIFKTEPVNIFKKFSIKVGMLLMGAGIGILVGNILLLTTDMEGEVAYMSMILLFSGAGLVSSYFVARGIKD